MSTLTRFALAALGSAALIATPAFPADHRDAPAITGDPAADINDVYVFVSPSDPSRMVLAMTVNPFISATGQGPSAFSPDVRYRFNIDTTGDAVAEQTIDITFTPTVPGPQKFHAVFPGDVVVEGETTKPTFAATPNPAIVVDSHSIKAFAGIRDDPFFFDLVGFNRFLAGGSFTKVDSFAGFNVSAIVVEFPISMLSGGSRPRFQIWADTARQSLTVRRGPGAVLEQSSGPYRQIERMGNPAISTVLVPSAKKDLFNLAVPKDDAANFAGDFVEKLHKLGTNDTNIAILASVAVPDTLKFDPAMPSHFPNGRALADDVIDTLLFFIFNQPADPSTASDGVPANDVPFLSTFPYVAPPHQP